MFDAHCHLQFEAFDGRDVVDEAWRGGVSGMISCDYDSTRRERLQKLAQRRGVWATCGLHPWALPVDARKRDDELRAVFEIAPRADWIGVGEFGLDALRTDEVSLSQQAEVAAKLLGLANEIGRPVVLHIVRAEHEMLELLKLAGGVDAGGMCHGFSGTPEQARAFVDAGMHISIGTNAVRGNVGRVREVCRAIPRSWMLVETDAPSRPPEGVDGPNHPRYLHRVVEAVAGFVDDDPERIAEQTEENVRRLFQLGTATLDGEQL